MNLTQQQYYYQELQRRNSLLRAYQNLQSQKVGLSAETTPVVFSTMANESVVKSSEPKVVEAVEETIEHEPVVENVITENSGKED